jgi:peptide/nickel transport system substrate-binding protein
MNQPIPRRTLLKAFGLSAAAVPLLAACGGASAMQAATTGGRSSGQPRNGGQLLLGFSGGGANSSMDVHVQQDTMETFADFMLVDQLTRMDPAFELQNVLAEELDHNADGTEWTVRIKPGVEFHNGKTLSAEDVIFTFNRILNPKTGATAAGTVAMIQAMSQVDARTVRFELSRPTAWFDIAIGDGGATGIVPVGFNPADPVGTGPFKYESWQPGVVGVFTRWDNYWGQVAYLDSVRGLCINDQDALFNALIAGQVNTMVGLQAAQADQLQSEQGFVIYNSLTGAFNPITMRTDTGPLADVRIRQALRLCLDRDQVVESAYGGYAKPTSDLYSPYDPDYDKALQRTENLAQATALVRQAGKEGLSLTLVAAEVNPGIVEACQVLSVCAAKIGINIQVRQVDTATLFGPNYLQWDFAIDSYPALRYLTTASLNDAPGASINATHFSDPEYSALWYEASAEFDAAKRKDYITQMQQILFDRGGWIIPGFYNQVGAYKNTLTGFSDDLTGFGMFRDLNYVGFTAS